MSVTFLQGTVLPKKSPPVAVVTATPEFGVVGSVIRLDGRQSRDPDGNSLTYRWEFAAVPIGSKVRQEPFRLLDPEGALVSFSPDIVGEYVVRLTVSNGIFETSILSSSLSIRAILVPQGRGLIPDGKWVWSYVRDCWTQVENREWFETLWSALIQIVGSEMLKLYQVDFNKSIRDIQDLFQRRWLAYSPLLTLEEDGLSFFLGDHRAGTDAFSNFVDLGARFIVVSPSDLILVQGSPIYDADRIDILSSAFSGNVGTFQVHSANAKKRLYHLASPALNDTADRLATSLVFSFSAQAKTWAFEPGQPGVASLCPGDVLYFASGKNVGPYVVSSVGQGVLEVDRAPSAASEPGDVATAYRSVVAKLQKPESLYIDNFAIPGELSPATGRLVTFGGQSFAVARTQVEGLHQVPFTRVTVDASKVLSGLTSQSWRLPHTLVSDSQNFEELGVSAGDTLLADVYSSVSPTAAEVRAQVVGVSGNRIGFVLTTEPVTQGVIPSVPFATLEALAQAFGIPAVYSSPNGDQVISDEAAKLVDSLATVEFSQGYWNRELTPSSPLVVGDVTFTIRPKAILRNSLLPVDSTLESVPALQEFIAQPTLSRHDGKVFQVVQGQEYQLDRDPVVLTENVSYIVDAEYAFDDLLTFATGSRDVRSSEGDFVDRGVCSGDVLSVTEPSSLKGDYPIETVVGPAHLRLSTAIPLHADGTVVASVRIKRKRPGKFLRFAPGIFTAKEAAPARLWAEVSFFDNSQTIEDNFGILVGLRKKDLEEYSTRINYRQAVAGLMYAFTKGSSIDRVKLGAHILLGLPFAENRGVIRTIDPDYRVDSSGVPLTGRIVVEDVDASDTPQGVQRIYTYPIDLESDLAGLETSPATGAPYAVGDLVELFAPLCKGVVIDDYLTNAVGDEFSVATRLQQFHSMRLRANDSVFSFEELSLVSSFLQRITPSYISFVLSALSEHGDDVQIEDVLSGRIKGFAALTDNPFTTLDGALKFDGEGLGTPTVFPDQGAFTVRRFGTGAHTVKGSVAVSAMSGGFIEPKANEKFDVPLVEPGDVLLILTGSNKGFHKITSVADTVLAVETTTLQTEDDQRFVVLRPAKPLLYRGTAIAAGTADVVVPDGALITRNVAPGDWAVLLVAGEGSFHVVSAVKKGVSGTYDTATLRGAVPTGTGEILFFRPAFFPREFTSPELTISSDGSGLTEVSPLLHALSEPGDELSTEDLTFTSMLHYLATAGTLVADPPFPAGTGTRVVLKKRGVWRAGTSGPGWDFLHFVPREDVKAAFGSDQAGNLCTASQGSSSVQIANAPQDCYGARRDDLFVFTSGANASLDVGYGDGVYPIIEVLSGTLTLACPIAANAAGDSWKIVQRRF